MPCSWLRSSSSDATVFSAVPRLRGARVPSGGGIHDGGAIPSSADGLWLLERPGTGGRAAGGGGAGVGERVSTPDAGLFCAQV
eukprot:scaffold46566_cov35-Phaeocystis_antarctica.AAC.5